jgi:hypothetical protein
MAEVKTTGESAKELVKQGIRGETAIRRSLGETLSDPGFWVAMAAPIVVIIIALAGLYAFRNPSLVVSIVKSPTFAQDVGIAVGTTAILLFIYLKILQPVIRIGVNTRIGQKCPDRWAFNLKTGLCEPRYRTSCQPFPPDRFKSFQEQCDFATSCGTNWGGACTT